VPDVNSTSAGSSGSDATGVVAAGAGSAASRSIAGTGNDGAAPPSPVRKTAGWINRRTVSISVTVSELSRQAAAAPVDQTAIRSAKKAGVPLCPMATNAPLPIRMRASTVARRSTWRAKVGASHRTPRPMSSIAPKLGIGTSMWLQYLTPRPFQQRLALHWPPLGGLSSLPIADKNLGG
jgi:hypothetical protein